MNKNVTITHEDAVRVNTRQEHYEILEYLENHGIDVDEWSYEEFPIIGWNRGHIIGWMDGCHDHYISKEEFYQKLGLLPDTSYEGSILKFNFINNKKNCIFVI